MFFRSRNRSGLFVSWPRPAWPTSSVWGACPGLPMRKNDRYSRLCYAAVKGGRRTSVHGGNLRFLSALSTEAARNKKKKRAFAAVSLSTKKAGDSLCFVWPREDNHLWKSCWQISKTKRPVKIVTHRDQFDRTDSAQSSVKHKKISCWKRFHLFHTAVHFLRCSLMSYLACSSSSQQRTKKVHHPTSPAHLLDHLYSVKTPSAPASGKLASSPWWGPQQQSWNPSMNWSGSTTSTTRRRRRHRKPSSCRL